MIRTVTIAALLCLLVLVLYLPSAHPPERFLAQIRAEHQAMAQLWGESPADRILNRALSLYDPIQVATPVPQAASAPTIDGVNGAVAIEMASMNTRLFNNSYFRSIEALLVLAVFRLSTLLEWLHWLAAFGLAVMVDGAITRVVKSREFRQHDPELFALYASSAVVTACVAVIALVLPSRLHPMVMAGLPMAGCLLLSGALANFHRRG